MSIASSCSVNGNTDSPIEGYAFSPLVPVRVDSADAEEDQASQELAWHQDEREFQNMQASEPAQQISSTHIDNVCVHECLLLEVSDYYDHHSTCPEFMQRIDNHTRDAFVE